jgi:FAD/FMN-containing dehydrogenase
VPEVLKYQPDSFESYDDHTFSIALKYLPELAAQMKAGLLSLGFSFLPELIMALTGGLPTLVLLVEFRGNTQVEALQRAEALATEVRKNKAHESVRVAPNEAAARKYWVVRRESFNLLRKKVRGKRTAPFIDDFVVPPASLPEFLPKLEALLAQYPNLTYTVAGHVGDGNFHIIPLIDPKDPTIGRTIDELSHKVYDLVLSYQGSITGEHNDGLVRTPYVEKMFGREMYALFLEVKKIFDPQNIFNPGKKVGTTFSDAFAKLDLPAQAGLPKVQ